MSKLEATTDEDPPTGSTPSSSKPSEPRWYRKLLPLLLAAGLVAYVLLRIDWDAFLHYVRRANYLGFALFMLVFIVVLLAADAFATAHVYRRCAPRLRVVELFMIRGASYLPSLLNHHVGQAWLTYAMAKTFKVDAQRMVGGTLLVYATWGGCMLSLACVALVAANWPLGWLFGALGAGLAYLILLAVKPARLSKIRLLAPLFEAGVSGHLLAMLVRLPHMVVLFVGTWVPFLFFEVEVPLQAALGLVPILMVAVTIPITPQGVGTRDALAASFFAGYVTAGSEQERLAAVAAATTSTAVVLVIVEVIVGLALWHRVAQMIERADPS